MTSRSLDIIKYSAILLLILLISFFHYETSTDHRYLHELYQRIYYIPILLAAYWYGPLKGILAAAFASLLYIYHIERDWSHFPIYAFNQYAEIVMYHAVAFVIGFLSQKDRRQRDALRKTSNELSEAYQQLRNTFEQLKKADRLAVLGKLSAGIAHEIRNPLASIKGSIEILEGEIPADNPKQEFVKIIKEEAIRLNSIVAEVLKFARPPKPSMDPTSVNELINSTLTLFQNQIQTSQVRVLKQLDQRLPLANLDPDQIRQVLLNIMLNAIQAMPAGGIMEVRSCLGNEGKKVTIEITDTGDGISEEDIDNIFDPFFTTKPQGTGLGLAISHQLVENHGGSIQVIRNSKAGVTFRIELPLNPALDLALGKHRNGGV